MASVIHQAGKFIDYQLGAYECYSIQCGMLVYFYNSMLTVGSPNWLVAVVDYSNNFNQGFEDG